MFCSKWRATLSSRRPELTALTRSAQPHRCRMNIERTTVTAKGRNGREVEREVEREREREVEGAEGSWRQ